MQLMSHSQAIEFVQREGGMSRETFDSNIRPRVIERAYGGRVKRYLKVAVEQAMLDPSYAEAEGTMFRKRRTLADALDHVWDTEWHKQKGARNQKGLIKLVKADIGSKQLRKITYNVLDEWVGQMRERELAEATVARRLSAVMKALKVAHRKEWISEVPPKPPTSVDNTQDRYLTKDEQAALFGACTNPVMRHVMGFLLDTGCRLSELMRCRPQDVLDDGVLFIDRKAGGNLKVPLTARARTSIKALHRDPWWLHWTRNVHATNKGLRDTALETLRTRLSHDFGKVRKAAGLHGVSLHTLRHTCGSTLAQAGVAMHIIQRMLGHADITVTSKRYAHLAPNSLLSIVNVLEMQESDNVVPIDKQRINED